MEDRHDIWRRLQYHEIPPPREVFDRIVFLRLQEHSIAPPVPLLQNIKEALFPQREKRPRRQTRLLFLTMAAAACVIAAAIGIVLLRPPRDRQPAVARSTPQNPPPKQPANTETIAPTPTTSQKTADSNTIVALADANFTIDGARFELVDNNPLLTFTSYHYPGLTKHTNKNTLKVHLDQYTNITLSPSMTGMIKDLYDTKSSGKPSRRARKTRERLEKWRTTDSGYFTPKDPSVNPLDPIDLAEFLFDGKRTNIRVSVSKTPPPMPNQEKDLTVSYTLAMATKRNIGIGETYNGGIETLFAGQDHARLRLASLMRIQSILLDPKAQTVTILTESGKPRSKKTLTAEQWSKYNAKYAGVTINPTKDTTAILGYPCKQAFITLADGRRITVWYTPGITAPVQSLIEPAFDKVPGLVLQYEYTCRRKTLRYTATAVSRRPIDAGVFTLP